MIGSVYVLGLTGQTGAGKTQAARVLAGQGFYHINADDLARRIVEPGTPCLRELAEAFSAEILNPDGTLDRRTLARIAFASPEKTALLNSITHPYVIALSEKLIREHDGEFAVLDVPLLFGSGAERLCDRIAVILAAEETRLARIMARDGISEAAARDRMKAQPDEEFYRSRADELVDGNASAEQVRRQVIRLAERIREVRHAGR